MKLKKLAIITLMTILLILLGNKVEATTGKINSDTVNVRKEASTKSSVLTQLDKNDEVEILEESEGWYKVKLTEKGKEVTGYVNSKLVDEQKEETNQPTPEEPKQEENNEPIEEGSSTDISTDIKKESEYELQKELEIKLLPTMSSRTKTTINNGNVKVLEIINDWCKVNNNQNKGWVRVNLLKKSIKDNDITDDTKPEPQEEQDSTQNKPQQNNTSNEVLRKAYVNSDGLRVRKEPNTSSKIVDSLSQNTEVSILEELEDWYKIKVNGNIGYVSSKYISNTKVQETTSRGETQRTELEKENTQKQEEKVEEKVEQKVEENKEVEQNNKEETSNLTETTGVSGAEIVEFAKKYLGYKYVSGGTSPSGFDCSGYTVYVYNHFGISLGRVAAEQNNAGVAVEKENLQLGDLVIFKDRANRSIGHVGIYIGDGKFIHSSNEKDGVKITELSLSYYKARYVGARRVI